MSATANDLAALQRLERRALMAEQALVDLAVHVRTIEATLDRVRAERSTAKSALAAAEATATAAVAERDAAVAEIDALKNTITMRALDRPRQLYANLRNRR